MLRFDQVGYRYKPKRPAVLAGLDLTLASGKIHGLLGRNGAGKTTLLKLAAGLLFPTQGYLTWQQQSVGQRSPHFLSDIFFLPETIILPPVTPAQYRDQLAPFYPRFDGAWFDQALCDFEIATDQRLNQMSAGQQKKFLLAFGLACHCRLYLLDEPSNGLDIPSKSQLRRILAGQVAEDRTFVLSTHQARDLEGLLDSIIIVDSGRVVFQQDRWVIEAGLSQTTTKTEPEPDSLFTVKNWDSWTSLMPNRGLDGQGIDLEVLFSAVLADPIKILSALEATHA